MDVIIEQYFDVGLMLDELDPVFKGFQQTILLSVFGGVLSLLWGLVLAVLRQLPGRALGPVRALTIAYIDAFRGIPSCSSSCSSRAASARWHSRA